MADLNTRTHTKWLLHTHAHLLGSCPGEGSPGILRHTMHASWLLLLAGSSLCSAARPRPAIINAAYAAGCAGDGAGGADAKTLAAATAGVNVILWFSISLANVSGAPAVTGGPPLNCIAATAAALRARGLATTHMITVGGWDAPHPSTAFPAETMYAAWSKWNEEVVAAAGLLGGFDGVDWDLEGNDNATSVFNTMSVETLALVGRFSQLARADDYIVSLVPCGAC